MAWRVSVAAVAVGSLLLGATDASAGYTSPPSSLAYVSGDRDSLVIQSRSGAIKWIADWTGTPAWSPDGRRVAFGFISNGSSGWGEIGVSDLFGNVRTVTGPRPFQSDAQPTWSPDGKRLAFSRTAFTRGVDGTPHQSTTDLFVIGVDGSHLHRLTRDGATDAEPAWSPDGHTIVFVRSGNINAFDFRDDVERPLIRNGAEPVWSPNGRQLAFDRVVPATTTVPDEDAVFVTQPGSGHARRVTPHGFNASWPTWSPTGSEIAFAATRGTTGLINVYSEALTGNRPPRLRASNASFPGWQPIIHR